MMNRWERSRGEAARAQRKKTRLKMARSMAIESAIHAGIPGGSSE